jgi:hypothetical protein
MKAILLSLVTLVAVNVFAADYNPFSYAISNAGNCKLMINYQYAGYNVDDTWCYPINGYAKGTTLKYEWSNKGNCKKMINGSFTGTLVSDYYCAARH